MSTPARPEDPAESARWEALKAPADVEQAAVTACGDLAHTLRAHRELRRLARQLVDTAENMRRRWDQADDAARGWMRDLLHRDADDLRAHLDATDPEGPTT